MTFISKEKFGRPCGVLCFICTCQNRKELNLPDEVDNNSISETLMTKSIDLNGEVSDMVNENFWDLI